MYQALDSWGYALTLQARTKRNEEASRLFTAAYLKYEAAMLARPDHQSANNWGIALADQAKTKRGEEADRLFAQAYRKFEVAVALKPEKHNAFWNWGRALRDQARTKRGNEADVLFEEAYAKFEESLRIKPDKHEALHSWGDAVADQAKTKSEEQANALLQRAHDLLVRAEPFASGTAACSLARVSALQGRPDECKMWLTKAADQGKLLSRAKLEQDSDFDSVRDTDWFKEILERAPAG